MGTEIVETSVSRGLRDILKVMTWYIIIVYVQKVDLSIFTYINSFQQIFPGAFINAVVRRFEKRN